MTTYYIYEITDQEYVALPSDQDGPFDTPDGQVNIDTDGAWIPGSQQDLAVSLADKALAQWLTSGNS